MLIRLIQHLHTNNILIIDWKGISTEDAALRLTDSVLKSINQKMNVEEFSVIWQRLWIVYVMKFS
jgi:hypothetical protein